MNMLRIYVIFSIFWFTTGVRLPQNRTTSAVLISKYAKVAKWGVNDNSTNTNQGRSYTSIWTPRSNSNSNNDNHIVYQYPVYQKPYKKADNNDVEIVPGIGEVIQDRFQVRPYFGYKEKDTANTYLPPTQSSAPVPAPIVATPVQNPPTAPAPQIVVPKFQSNNFKVPLTDSLSSSPSNLYDSPFTSYNPPPRSNSDTDQNVFPPNVSPSQTNNNGDSFTSNGNKDSYANTQLNDDGPYNYQPEPKEPVGNHNHNNFYEDAGPPSNSYGTSQQDTSPSIHQQNDNGPPKEPPKSINDIYYPPDFPKDQIQENYGDHVADTMDMAPQNDHKGHDNVNLVPPTGSHDFSKYLYDDHHYDHHVYEEVPHVTTTPAPEMKRVSSTNYSYYYLGRKLWYIPLYFSIYFMIYVTALIIKSIARHKVTLRNEWITANSRSARDMTFHHMETIDEIHKNITNAIDKADKLYSGYAM